MKNLLIAVIAVILITSCDSDKPVDPILERADYDTFLNTSDNKTHDEAHNEMTFWSKRLRPDSSGVGDLGPLAAAHTTLFKTTGDPTYLDKAVNLYKKGITISANNKDIYARGLAHTYVSQHKFKEAKDVLETSYSGVSNKRATEHMLFDVYMELGEYDKAEAMLAKLRNMSDYNYLIRLSKWNDHIGDLDAAITIMEKAKEIADSRKSKSLQIWTYSNLADYYGHAGRIKDSYEHYLKTLELQPDNFYVKKGLAWIAYAYEKDTDEANRILDSLMINHKIPDYYLLKSEIAEFEGNYNIAEDNIDKFLAAVRTGKYGNMYNTYLIEILSEDNPEQAIELANMEISNRATPETYQLLAFAELKAGNEQKALSIIEDKIEDKTYEPMALYYSAIVYKANGMNNKVKAIKKELIDASFEIGPVLANKVAEL